MDITVNGQSRSVSDGASLERLLVELGYAGRRLAVEINHEIIPRSAHAATRLQPGDRVEIVQAIGGGSPGAAGCARCP
ncbi:MAG: sulfur carrier protein ThiS [Gammaproteobacteria bacterium]|nr:sulfur carrier protein ThiS [Gammaproteobacteria bacterium]